MKSDGGNKTVCKEVPPLIQNTPKKAPASVGYKQESANTSGGKKK
jgi:hypothetical protein